MPKFRLVVADPRFESMQYDFDEHICEFYLRESNSGDYLVKAEPKTSTRAGWIVECANKPADPTARNLKWEPV